MSWPIVDELQRRIEDLATKQAQMLSRLAETEQSTIKVWMDQGGGGGGSQVKALWCMTPSAVSAATGVWPTLTPHTFTADVYANGSGTLTIVAPGSTVYWWYKDAIAAGKLIPVIPNADGSYDAVASSCTRVDV